MPQINQVRDFHPSYLLLVISTWFLLLLCSHYQFHFYVLFILLSITKVRVHRFPISNEHTNTYPQQIINHIYHLYVAQASKRVRKIPRSFIALHDYRHWKATMIPWLCVYNESTKTFFPPITQLIVLHNTFISIQFNNKLIVLHI